MRLELSTGKTPSTLDGHRITISGLNDLHILSELVLNTYQHDMGRKYSANAIGQKPKVIFLKDCTVFFQNIY